MGARRWQAVKGPVRFVRSLFKILHFSLLQPEFTTTGAAFPDLLVSHL